MKKLKKTALLVVMTIMLDITTEVGQTFAKSDNLEIKRLLLKFVFENITLTEGEISYKLNFPFNEFTKTKILEKNTKELHEQEQSLVNQDLQANYNQQLQFGCGKSHEVEQGLKNKGVAKIFATPLQFGRQEPYESEEKVVINYQFFLSNYDKVMAMKEQVQFIREMIKSPPTFLRGEKAKTVMK